MNTNTKHVIILSFTHAIGDMWCKSNYKDSETGQLLSGRTHNKLRKIMQIADGYLSKLPKLSKAEISEAQTKLDRLYKKLNWIDSVIDLYMSLTLAATMLDDMPDNQEIRNIGILIADIITHYGNKYSADEHYKAGLDAAAVWQEIVG